MSNIGLQREFTTLQSEQKINELALKGHQSTIADMLINGSMGKDIDDVLSGKKKVKLSFWQKLKYKFRFYLELFIDNGIQTRNSEYNGVGKYNF